MTLFGTRVTLLRFGVTLHVTPAADTGPYEDLWAVWPPSRAERIQLEEPRQRDLAVVLQTLPSTVLARALPSEHGLLRWQGARAESCRTDRYSAAAARIPVGPPLRRLRGAGSGRPAVRPRRSNAEVRRNRGSAQARSFVA